MPLHQEATFHDRQSVNSVVLQQTSSSTFSDVTGATITAKDLSQSGDYIGWLSVLMSNNSNNATVSFRVTLNGAPSGNVATIMLRFKDLDVGHMLMSDFGGVGISAGDVLQLQYATDIGTLSLASFSILVDGVPTSRVV